MQSQQKRLKWSRGETAEALEERTDTGITQASVELMENCTPDIYGNISRRPSLKPIPLSSSFKTNAADDDLYIPVEDVNHAYRNDKSVQFVPFYISEDDIILICVNSDKNTYVRIKDGKIVYEYNGYNNIQSITTGYLDNSTGNMVFNMVSYAQQNNYMLIATDKCVYKVQFTFANTGYAFTPVVGLWEYTAGWYAPNGTQTKEVSSSDIVGLNFQSNSIGNYIYTETNGSSTVYSWIKTGISSGVINTTWTGSTTTFYVTNGHKITNVQPQTALASFTITNGTTYVGEQVLAHYTVGSGLHQMSYDVKIRINSQDVFLQVIGTYSPTYYGDPYFVTQYTSTTLPAIIGEIPVGCIVQFPNNGAYMRVEGYDSDGTNLRMYGSFLTPVADNNTTDTRVNVEYGYESLQPLQWSYSSIFPHPTELTFLDQRLWAGGWAASLEESYSLVIGSQIARYDDLKNNYNQENEPITLDILTQFKEKVTHLVDYNGLKIFTDSFEYAYDNGAIVKQSANGSTEWCEPIVFEGLCLYVDSTGNQIRAMQYEFQSNIFNSSCINQLAPHDLIWYPTYMSSFEDKIYSTGKHLFVVNEPRNNDSILAVCNFVPSNQANIWSRWSFPQYVEHPLSVPDTIYNSNMVHSIINTKNKPIFVLKSGSAYTYAGGSISYNPTESYTFCVLDYEENLDLEGTITADNEFAFNLTSVMSAGYLMKRYQTLVHTDIAIYSNGEYQFTTTTDRYGKITADLSGLTNVTAGLMINSTVRSHPIDVGGKTKSIKKRIGKTVMSVHDTEAGAITINGKTGYMNPQGDKISFYGVTGMKDEIKYTLTNKNGAMFHLESLLMNIEYGTLDS